MFIMFCPAQYRISSFKYEGVTKNSKCGRGKLRFLWDSKKNS